jgi:polyhydroxyalkanoate synthase
MTVENRPSGAVARARADAAPVDLAAAVESLLPADLLARVDASLWGRTSMKLAQGWATHPGEVTRSVAAFAGASARIGSATLSRVLGGDAEAPMGEPRDGRFKDTTWSENPAYWALRQEYLALVDLLESLAHAAGLDQDSEERAELMLGLLGSILSPTNVLPGNPSALKRAFETGGSSVVAGLRAMLSDVATNNGRPLQVDAT